MRGALEEGTEEAITATESDKTVLVGESDFRGDGKQILSRESLDVWNLVVSDNEKEDESMAQT